MKQALYFDKIENLKVYCKLCPHNCIINPDRVGICRVRKNIGGELYSLNYGKITSLALDPIEKKPLYRFYPGSMILSAGSFGCNLKCSFCQNWNIAHDDKSNGKNTIDVKPRELVDKALQTRNRGNIGIAYTYNEPSIWFEYVYETARLAKDEGLMNILVTNGFIEREPLMDLLPFIDAVNIDVKAFTASFYKSICGAALENVKENVEICAKRCHVEITTLVIPDLNDSLDEIGELSKWISSISTDIPLHLSRFFPNYRMRDKPSTPVETIIRAREKALENIKYVYAGNIW